ncbi:MAG TPA: hypothetical protein VFL04_04495, partial [Rectinemataceae bacterium]|nr:hypothetical protein [Rectinemataceae bacterium]
MWKPASTLVIGVAAIALVAGGAVAGDYPLTGTQTGPGLASARTELMILSAALSPRSLAGAGPEFAAAAARALVRSADLSGVTAKEAMESGLPKPDAVLAMLALDRDVDDFLESSALGGPVGAHYRKAAELAGRYRPLRAAYEAAYASMEREIAAAPTRDPRPKRIQAQKGKDPLFDRGHFLRPTMHDIRFAHPYALDVFFDHYKQGADGQTGPSIPSISGGLVVAAAGDWRGGPGPQAWAGGGLSPAAGNGLVVYDPETRRYYSYFHLRSLSVACGELVERGRILGTGG